MLRRLFLAALLAVSAFAQGQTLPMGSLPKSASLSYVAQTPSAYSGTMNYGGCGGGASAASSANLYDGDDATRAADGSGLTSSTAVAYDLGSAKAIVRLRTITTTDGPCQDGWSNTDGTVFDIQYSDTAITGPWTNVTTHTMGASRYGDVVVTTWASVGAHRYWKWAYKSGTTGGDAWLGELTFYTYE